MRFMINLKQLKNGEFFEIKMLSIGGLGAYTTGQMLGEELSKFEELKTSIFASYSSEKKGAPINVFLRFLKSNHPIRNFSTIKNPNFLIVFKEELLNFPGALEGIDSDTILLINTHKDINLFNKQYPLPCKHIFLVDAGAIAIQKEVKINMIMFGAIHKVLTFIDPTISTKSIIKKLSFRFSHLVDANVDAFNLGFDSCIYHFIKDNTKRKISTSISLGIDNQIPGGIIIGPNTQMIDRSISREGYIPIFDSNTCINCTKCDFTCPDDCFVWKEVEGRRGRMEMQLQGIDYQYCKGCMRCVEVCPTNSLTKQIETIDNINGVKKIYELMED